MIEHTVRNASLSQKLWSGRVRRRAIDRACEVLIRTCNKRSKDGLLHLAIRKSQRWRRLPADVRPVLINRVRGAAFAIPCSITINPDAAKLCPDTSWPGCRAAHFNLSRRVIAQEWHRRDGVDVIQCRNGNTCLEMPSEQYPASTILSAEIAERSCPSRSRSYNVGAAYELGDATGDLAETDATVPVKPLLR